ncbi:protein SMAX1-LIKE 3-like [Lycium barbarum]|uniref:protein SMAX1-LIKE 3-like n=1 Tax=Lycium barbarum TaxID=112863 RepID=UPI00293E3062|nr:protein SMAX1-LIKE 3-like [Lycium barbarum]
MRTNSGNYTFQQALTVESASIVKQALNLAKRRGHSHVTPLHVAIAMLVSSSSNILRKVCFQSHCHPLQYRTLELCFNVALNRLPTSGSSPILEPRVHPPYLSNALVAAFKRAQAYQRRGSIENQQQQHHLRVEIEQLLVSILDDPSVSRVMREAGFSSIQLKTNVEHAISSENSTKPMVIASGNNLKLSLCKSGDDPSVRRVMREADFSSIQLKTNVEHAISSENSRKPMVIKSGDNLNLSLCKSVDDQIKNDDDVMSVIEAMMNKKMRNTVIIGECLANAERAVRGVIDKFDKGEVSLHMKHVQFISVPLFTLRNVSKEEFAAKIRELRILLRSYINKGVVIYLGDLEWISEFWTEHNEQKNNYMIMELSRLLCGEMRGNGRLWLMGIASFETYAKCKTGCPSLQTLWDLHPLTIPVVNLDLSLNLESDPNSHFRTKTTVDDSTVKSEATTSYSSPSLPSWLHKYKEVNNQDNNNIQESEEMRNLCKKWNSICSCVHKHDHYGLSSSSPCSSTSIASSNKSKKEHQFLNTKPELLSNPNSSPNSTSSSEASRYMEHLDRLKELNSALCCSDSSKMLPHPCRILQNCTTFGGSDTHPSIFFNGPSNIDSEKMKILCKALEEKAPWQKDIIHEIVSTILECRHNKEETWLLFLGADSQGKEKISRELAKIIFGFQDSFISIGLSTFSSSTRTDSTDQEVSNKRSRDEQGRSYLERFADAIQENPSRVFFMEDIDQVDSFSQKSIQKAIETGKLTLPNGDLVFVKDSIVIFSCEEYFSSVSRTCSRATIMKFGERKEKMMLHGI